MSPMYVHIFAKTKDNESITWFGPLGQDYYQRVEGFHIAPFKYTDGTSFNSASPYQDWFAWWKKLK